MEISNVTKATYLCMVCTLDDIDSGQDGIWHVLRLDQVWDNQAELKARLENKVKQAKRLGMAQGKQKFT